ncbi:universal stress protein [Adhaeribacter aquaticus]|uniref:universal stress protein n=1 Tax=Adhaeribacter aquaticus TaxID=299567 RepID=UPI00047D6B3A|nr:universal stress protein [Adhaeribacter aquaticus]
MKTILVPIDFSVNADKALQYATTLAAHERIRIILYHNVAMQVNFSEITIWNSADPDLIEYYQGKLNKIGVKYRLENNFKFEVEAICGEGSLTDNLNKLVKEKRVDLVIMGTKGASYFVDRLLGTVAATYLEEAICPVLVVPAHTPAVLPKKIAYATDLEREEASYIKQLLAVATFLKTDITLVNISEDYELNVVSDEQVIDEIVQELGNHPFGFEQVKANEVVSGLEKYVLSANIDVLAVAMREHSELEKIFFQSTTDQLAFNAKIPLLIIPMMPYTVNNSTNHQTEVKN